MPLIHHVVSGAGTPPLVFIHGFSCDYTDWKPQVDAFAGRHKTVAVDLRGHGKSAAKGYECSIEALASDVAVLMRHLDLGPSVLIGHSMGCRIAIEVGMQVPTRTAGLILVDGSQFSAATEALVRQRIEAGELDAMLKGMFSAMFNERSDKAVADAIVARALKLPKDVAAAMSLDTVRYDTTRLEHALSTLKKPLMVVQSTYTNERRERLPLAKGQTVPYLDVVRARMPGARIEIIPGIGHFTQIDAPAETNALIASFIAGLPKS